MVHLVLKVRSLACSYQTVAESLLLVVECLTVLMQELLIPTNGLHTARPLRCEASSSGTLGRTQGSA